MSSFFGGLCRDVVIEILLYLDPMDLCSFATINREYKTLFEDDYVWEECFKRQYGEVGINNKGKRTWKEFFKDFFYEGMNWSMKPFEELDKFYGGWIIETDHVSKTTEIKNVGNHVLWLLMNRKISSESNVILTIEIESENAEDQPNGVFGVRWSGKSAKWGEYDLNQRYRNSYPKSYIHNSNVYCMSYYGRLFHEFVIDDTEVNLKKGGGRISLKIKDQSIIYITGTMEK